MSEHVLEWPLALPKGRLRRWVESSVGRLLVQLCPAQAQSVSRGSLPPRLGRWERLLIAGLVEKHRRTGTLDQLAPLHAWMWRSESARSFHKLAAEEFEVTWASRERRILDPIAELTGSTDSRFRTLCEIGCGSGKVLEDVAARLPGVERLVGLDLSEAQIELNRTRTVDSRISFFAADANEWIARHGVPGTVYLTVRGVLEYFRKRDLEILFARLAKELAPSAVALIEPVPLDYDFERETESRPYSFEHSVGHNYPRLLREAGFSIRFQELERFDEWAFVRIVAESPPRGAEG